MPKKTKVVPEKTPAKKVVSKTQPKKSLTENKQDGIVTGNYSTTTYQNGEKISFDIDWDRLREYMRTM